MEIEVDHPPDTLGNTEPTVFVEPPGPNEIKQIIRDVWPDDLEEKGSVVFQLLYAAEEDATSSSASSTMANGHA